MNENFSNSESPESESSVYYGLQDMVHPFIFPFLAIKLHKLFIYLFHF